MAFTTNDGEVITAADHAAGIVSGTAKTEYAGSSKLFTIRIPMHLALQLQAMAHKSGKSRNAIFGTMLEVGLEEVRERLDEKTQSELAVIESELYADMLSSEIEPC